jgi:predicted DNA-binding protein (UPF0251 family)
MEKRKFTYYLKLHSGRLVYSDGIDWQDAAREAGIALAEVKRHMPTAALRTPEELEQARLRIAKMLEKKRISEGGDENNE